MKRGEGNGKEEEAKYIVYRYKFPRMGIITMYFKNVTKAREDIELRRNRKYFVMDDSHILHC